MTLLHVAVRSGDTGKLDYMIGVAQNLQTIAEKDAWGRQAIHMAASIGNTEITRALLSKGSSLDQVDDTGKSPVDYLLKSKPDDDGGDRDPVTDATLERIPASNNKARNQSHVLGKDRCLILQEFAIIRPDYRDGTGKTFLHIAAQVADVDTIKALITSEKFEPEAIDERDSQRRTPLHYAILAGNTAVSLALLDEFASDPSAKDMGETSVLMFAVRKNLRAVVERLFFKAEEAEEHKRMKRVEDGDEKALEKCSLMDRDSDGRTALHYATDIDISSQGGEVAQVRMVNLLFSKGYDPTTRDTNGVTALHSAIDQRKEVIAIFLLVLMPEQVPTEKQEAKPRETILIAACRAPCPAVIPGILEIWPDTISDGDLKYDQPPISWACEEREKDVVKMLLQVPGVDVNRWTGKWRGYTPLHFAVATGDEEMLGWLLEKEDADVRATNENEETPVAMAVSRGYIPHLHHASSPPS